MKQPLTKIEGERELLSRRDRRADLDLRLVLPHHLGRELIVGIADLAATIKLELMQMRPIPTSKRGRHRGGYCATGSETASKPRVAFGA